MQRVVSSARERRTCSLAGEVVHEGAAVVEAVVVVACEGLHAFDAAASVRAAFQRAAHHDLVVDDSLRPAPGLPLGVRMPVVDARVIELVQTIIQNLIGLGRRRDAPRPPRGPVEAPRRGERRRETQEGRLRGRRGDGVEARAGEKRAPRAPRDDGLVLRATEGGEAQGAPRRDGGHRRELSLQVETSSGYSRASVATH